MLFRWFGLPLQFFYSVQQWFDLLSSRVQLSLFCSHHAFGFNLLRVDQTLIMLTVLGYFTSQSIDNTILLFYLTLLLLQLHSQPFNLIHPLLDLTHFQLHIILQTLYLELKLFVVILQNWQRMVVVVLVIQCLFKQLTVGRLLLLHVLQLLS